MKKYMVLGLLSLLLYLQSQAQGKLLVKTFTASSIAGNPAGEDPVRHVSVYLPPGYDAGSNHYPVIYFLHGFGLNDSLQILYTGFKDLLDKSIQEGKIKPLLVVFPDSRTKFMGSFYSNSSLTGNWADFIGKDLVDFIDQHFRTIPQKESRGLAGHSMGGHGALKIAMLFPGRFSAVYALSPAILNWGANINLDNPAYEAVGHTTPEEIFSLMQSPMGSPKWVMGFSQLLLVDLGRTYSPNAKKLPFQADLPVAYENGKPVQNSAVIKMWNDNLPYTLLDKNAAALKALSALKIDWGKQDQSIDLPTCPEFSAKLQSLGIKHVAEEYEGDHINKQGGTDGRIFLQLLPFFNSYLKFGEQD